ncbi:DUF1615 family protein [Acinetobacter sp. MD2(2019)]|uniref:DUF1615 family protein n=1 Tax=Acinetobacter sp. MD2(2019) TaxID=2605273 RepID=UPI002D1E5433|nr:DUF1615 family protein [Acinetobacter sp. MD2(2019)]MEB3754871.1 DUF1615 family protein [Acinetobacter sp. MD2(2019)]
MNKFSSYHRVFRSLSVLALCVGLVACGENSLFSKDDDEKHLTEKQINRLIPPHVRDRASWAKDMNSIMDDLKIEKNKQNVCSIVAIVDQESNFVANPQVPGLGQKAVAAVNSRLQEKFTDKLGDTLGTPIAHYFEQVLKTQPSPENSYLKQMAKVKTEQDLDVLYRQIFDYMSKHYHVSALTGAAKLVGTDIGERMNPVTTLGSMQVLVHYAQDHQKDRMNVNELRDYLYTQYGGLYYGIHRLMMYQADYDKPIYRFADYNSGMYSSRNASVQKAINTLAGTNLSLDGDLLLYDKNEDVQAVQSDSELGLIKLFTQNKVIITPRQLRSDLKQEKTIDFEKTQTYLTLLKLYKAKVGKDLPYAVMPQVIISGPKLSRDYNTNWYASRVNGRFESCMHRGRKIKS